MQMFGLENLDETIRERIEKSITERKLKSCQNCAKRFVCMYSRYLSDFSGKIEEIKTAIIEENGEGRTDFELEYYCLLAKYCKYYSQN